MQTFKITFFLLFFWINSVSGMVRAEIWNLVGKPPSLRRSAFEGSFANWFWFEWVSSLWKSYFVHIQRSILAEERKNHSGCDFGGLFSNTRNTGRLWCRRYTYPYVEIFSDHAQWIQWSALVCRAEDKTRPILLSLHLVQHKNMAGQIRSNDHTQDQDLGLLCNPLALQ